MAASSFGKRVLKEFQRGGKKSIVLTLLLLVGLFFWAPMLWRVIFPKRDTSPSATGTAKITPKTEATTQTTASTQTNMLATMDWRSLYRRLDKSSLIQPLALDDIVRDPFDPEWVRAKRKPPEVKTEVGSSAESNPLGTLVLSAILYAGQNSAAIINDVVYRIGQEVPERGRIRWVIKDVRPDRVLLERAGKIDELRLKDSELSNPEPAEVDQP